MDWLIMASSIGDADQMASMYRGFLFLVDRLDLDGKAAIGGAPVV